MNKTYKGKLEYYLEQGEICFPMLQDFRGISDQGYYSWDWAYVFGKQSKVIKITIWDKNHKKVYEGPWTYSRENTSKNNYFSSPKEIDPLIWRRYCIEALESQIESVDKVDADKERVILDHKKEYKLSKKTTKGYMKVFQGSGTELKEGDGIHLRKKVKIGYQEGHFGLIKSVVLKRESGIERIYIKTEEESFILEEVL